MAEKRPQTSLAFRLNFTLFFRQLRNYFWLDVLIGLLCVAGLFFYAEETAFRMMAAAHSLYGETGAGLLSAPGDVAFYGGGIGRSTARQAGDATEDMAGNKAGSTSGNIPGNTPVTIDPAAGQLLPAAGYTFTLSDSLPPGRLLPNQLARRLPAPWGLAGRRLWTDSVAPSSPFPEEALGRLWQPADLMSLVYDIWMQGTAAGPDGAEPHWLVVSFAVGRPLVFLINGMLVLMLAQGLSLLAALIRNAQSISQTLKPLQELTETTQALTAAGGRLSPDALKRLTGALDSINVSHLDARLPLSRFNDELKPLAAAINEMLARIDEAYRSQIRFVSDASHELRTPIAVIQGYANLLSRWGTEDPATLQESIQAIRSEADAMKEMVEQLLFLARGDNDSMHLDWAPVNVSALAGEVLREVEMIDQNHNFVGDIQPGVTVLGDGGLLKQLLRILTDNSIKYSPAGSMITLRVGCRMDHAAIVIQDEGAGISPQALPHIFDRFYRADESRTRNTGGTGLGLAIAKWIAQRHEGCIDVLSRENIGTRMTVLVPLAPGENPGQQGSSVQQSTPGPQEQSLP